MSLIDQLVNVKISISEGADSGESFSGILLVGPAPAAGGEIDNDVAKYASLEAIADAGWETTDEVYKAAAIAFRNGTSELFVSVIKEEDDATTDPLDIAINVSGWYGIGVCGVDSSKFADIATWAENNGKLFGYTVSYTSNTANPITNDSYNYSFGFATSKVSENEDNKYLAIAVLAKVMSYQAGSETWAYKTLTGITADAYTSNEISTIEGKNLNCYVECAGKAITLQGKTVSGEWIDVIRFRDWLINDMQTRIFNLFIMNPKVPYTDSGITLIQNQMIASLKEGQSVGGIAETEYDEDGNEIPGYTTSVPLSSSVSSADKGSRRLSNCKFTARLANAIHLVEISGTLTS